MFGETLRRVQSMLMNKRRNRVSPIRGRFMSANPNHRSKPWKNSPNLCCALEASGFPCIEAFSRTEWETSELRCDESATWCAASGKRCS